MCLALGHTSIAETFALSSAEWAFWLEFYQRYGFPLDRVEAGVAIAGAAMCRTQGSKVEPRDLQVRFTRHKPGNKELIAAWSAMPGAPMKFIPRQSEGTANG